MTEKTLFERIIAREIPADIVFEDDDVLAFRDISPQAPTHILVIPKKPIPMLSDISSSDYCTMGKMVYACTLAKEMGLDEDGYRVVINNRTNTSNGIHLHMHVLGGRGFSCAGKLNHFVSISRHSIRICETRAHRGVASINPGMPRYCRQS